MALSLSNFLVPITLFLLLYGTFGEAATVTYNFNVSWVQADPAGVGETRSVIGINGQWPLPRIEVTKGDRVIINAHNGLNNETTSLHMHGIFMNGSTHMDGASQVSQCAIPPGGSFTYNFTVCPSFRDLVSYDANSNRPSNRVRTGTTRTSKVSTRTACAAPSSSTIPTARTKTSMMKRLSSPSPTGITTTASIYCINFSATPIQQVPSPFRTQH
jgi:Multicopper oxidase